MDVLLDTNIVLDVLLNRPPFVTSSIAVWQAQDDGAIIGHIAATTLTNIFFIVRKVAGLNDARAAVRICLDAFTICAVDRQTLEMAEQLPGNDFEDNVQIACAIIAGAVAIITRDKTGFTAAPMAVYTPDELLAFIPKE
jgi:predicted nucleic acid-binding protein